MLELHPAQYAISKFQGKNSVVLDDDEYPNSGTSSACFLLGVFGPTGRQVDDLIEHFYAALRGLDSLALRLILVALHGVPAALSCHLPTARAALLSTKRVICAKHDMHSALLILQLNLLPSIVSGSLGALRFYRVVWVYVFSVCAWSVSAEVARTDFGNWFFHENFLPKYCVGEVSSTYTLSQNVRRVVVHEAPLWRVNAAQSSG